MRSGKMVVVSSLFETGKTDLSMYRKMRVREQCRNYRSVINAQ